MVEAPNPGPSTGAGNAPRADASTLHVDFEKVTDTLVMARNGGVFLDPWTRDPRSRIRILDSFGFSGPPLRPYCCQWGHRDLPAAVARPRCPAGMQ